MAAEEKKLTPGSEHVKDEAPIGSEAKVKVQPSSYLQKLYQSGTPELAWMNNMAGLRKNRMILPRLPKTIWLKCLAHDLR